MASSPRGTSRAWCSTRPCVPAYPWQHAPRTTSGLTGGLTGSPVGTAVNVESTWVADVTGDAVPDLVHARENEGIAVWPGNGDGTFASDAIDTSITVRIHRRAHRERDRPSSATSTAMPRIDLISVTDGVGVSANSGTRVWLGNGDGTFATAPIVDLGGFVGTRRRRGQHHPGWLLRQSRSTLLADVNERRPDGHSSGSTMATAWRRTLACGRGSGNGDGTFQSHADRRRRASPARRRVGVANIIQAGYEQRTNRRTPATSTATAASTSSGSTTAARRRRPPAPGSGRAMATAPSATRSSPIKARSRAGRAERTGIQAGNTATRSDAHGRRQQRRPSRCRLGERGRANRRLGVARRRKRNVRAHSPIADSGAFVVVQRWRQHQRRQLHRRPQRRRRARLRLVSDGAGGAGATGVSPISPSTPTATASAISSIPTTTTTASPTRPTRVRCPAASGPVCSCG